MSKKSYQRLLRLRYNYHSNNQMPLVLAKQLDEILQLPHPYRESEFVNWCQQPLHKEYDFMPEETEIRPNS